MNVYNDGKDKIVVEPRDTPCIILTPVEAVKLAYQLLAEADEVRARGYR
jgi:hypothetical protein